MPPSKCAWLLVAALKVSRGACAGVGLEFKVWGVGRIGLEGRAGMYRNLGFRVLGLIDLRV